MTDRKMCKFYNLNVPERRSGDGGNQNHGGGGNNEEDERHDRGPVGEEAVPPHVPPHEHKLEYSYWMWFSRRPPARDLSASTTGYGQVRTVCYQPLTKYFTELLTPELAVFVC